MLIMGIALVIAIGYVEVQIVDHIRPLAWLLERYPLASLGFSLALSAICGAFFGAAGAVVFAAGIVSTVAVQPYYYLRRSGKLQQMRDAYYERKEAITERIQQLIRIGTAVVYVCSYPIKALLLILDFTDKCITLTQKVRNHARTS